jgi:predicted dehydrogenase
MGFPLRIAVAGSGIGASHIEGFQELPNLFDIKILSEVNRERATAVAEKYRIRCLLPWQMPGQH